MAFSLPLGLLPERSAAVMNFPERPLKKQRQVAVTAVVMVVKGKLLLTMGFIFRMVHVQNKHFGNFGKTADELIHKNLSKTIEVS